MKKESAELLKKGAHMLGAELETEQLASFDLFLAELQRWNKKLNLTAISDEQEIVIYHFLDSLTCLLSSKIGQGAALLDIGTGAGFPGIPLAIVRPDISLSLVESVNKKAEFLRSLISALGLRGRVLAGRAEEFARTPERASYDTVVARAVAALAVLCEYALPFLRNGGCLIAQKSKRAKEELEEGRIAAALLGGEEPEVIPVSVPFAEAKRFLVLVRKTRETPERYPRRPGIPAKRPLGKTTQARKG